MLNHGFVIEVVHGQEINITWSPRAHLNNLDSKEIDMKVHVQALVGIHVHALFGECLGPRAGTVWRPRAKIFIYVLFRVHVQALLGEPRA